MTEPYKKVLTCVIIIAVVVWLLSVFRRFLREGWHVRWRAPSMR